MKVIYVVLSVAITLVGYMIICKKCMCGLGKSLMGSGSPPTGTIEKYGGNQTKCEEICFSSPYYEACMNSCMQDGRADYEETGNEYDVLGVKQVDDLDRGYGYDTPNSWPENPFTALRGSTPGK